MSVVRPNTQKNMRTLKILSFLILMLPALVVLAGGIKGEGPVVENSRSVTLFNQIENGVGAIVHISKSDKQLDIKLKGQQNILDVLFTRVKGDKLVLGFSKKVSHCEQIEIFISIPEVRGLQISGSGKVDVKDAFMTEKLSLDVFGSGIISGPISGKILTGSINGSGRVDVAGNAEEVKVTIDGSGSFAINEPVKVAKLTINGSGKIKVEPKNELDITINGSGLVDYVGNPAQVNQQLKGSGRIRKVE
jgi:hypothetical protein